ncbi:MAG: SPFH domain-containing protein [Chitinophagaceae bacterium]
MQKVILQLYRFGKLGRIIGGVLIVLGIFISAVIQIDAGEVGIKVLFGSVKKDVLSSGLHFVNPLYEIKKVDVKTQNYTMSGQLDEGNKVRR